jgi:hypothetical protein
LDDQGKRSKAIEVLASALDSLSTASDSVFTPAERTMLASTVIPEMLGRDLTHKGLLSESVTMSWKLLAWVELS